MTATLAYFPPSRQTCSSPSTSRLVLDLPSYDPLSRSLSHLIPPPNPVVRKTLSHSSLRKLLTRVRPVSCRTFLWLTKFPPLSLAPKATLHHASIIIDRMYPLAYHSHRPHRLSTLTQSLLRRRPTQSTKDHLRIALLPIAARQVHTNRPTRHDTQSITMVLSTICAVSSITTLVITSSTTNRVIRNLSLLRPCRLI